MKLRGVCCGMILLGIGSHAAAQETRQFPEADCSYTLPGKDWSWLDPHLVHTSDEKPLLFAKGPNGLTFTLTCDDLKPGEKPKANSYESFEAGFLSGGGMTKLDSRHLTFKGIASYQFDVLASQGQGLRIRALYANNRFYQLHVVNARGRVGPDGEVDPIFDGFAFTSPPQPMLPSKQGTASRQGQPFARMTLILIAGGIGVLLVVGIVVTVVLLTGTPRRKRKRHDAREWDY